MIATALASQTARIGTETGLSDWVTIDQNRINVFAEITEDPQWIHTDPVRAAAETPFGGTIAHGFLTLSMASKFSIETFTKFEGQTMGINYGFNKVRFLSPVCAGDRIRGRFVLQTVTQKSTKNLLQEHQLTIEIKGKDTPALVCNWLGMAVFG
ncbi:MAG TPA: nodulation protein NodN [Rhodobacteraceae bacterium]|nr:MaoC family dehydratase [Amylibacter sp.]MDG1236979.1 MaoC family dehydratase [Amylibacter sp.]MDG1999771.1 MaoC family dehydratase [Amylibacter sp.]HAD28724.1 nodulation protein NodN [Paracoccaceae bacterium]|tara:strand:+ start:1015 stop:1476 length:462 start_codon:yes stop_codon:yes gene_type:complete